MNISVKVVERLHCLQVVHGPAFSFRGVCRSGVLHLKQQRQNFSGVCSKMASSVDNCNDILRNGAGVVLPATEEFAGEAIEALSSGKVIAVPTDTLYGFACDACSREAVNRIYEIKGRKHTNPLAICVGDVSDIKRFAVTDQLPETLLDALLPGPVTVVLRRASRTRHFSGCIWLLWEPSYSLGGVFERKMRKRKAMVILIPHVIFWSIWRERSQRIFEGESSILEKSLNPGLDSIGVRVPDCDFIRIISQRCGSALALTSANLSGQPSSVCIKDFENLWGHCACIFDGGDLPMGRAGSTVVDVTRPGIYKILRPGSAREETVAILEKHGLQEDGPLT